MSAETHAGGSGLRSAVGFLTVIGGAAVPSQRTAGWFPIVGAALGAALAGLWWLADSLWAPAVAAAVVVAADLALTGMLHVDGLADSADGLVGPMDRERRLAVMRTPDVGAFALAVVPTVFLLRFAALASAPPALWPGVLIGVVAMGRLVMVLTMAWVPYARGHGLASTVASGARRIHALWLAPVAAVLIGAEGWRGAAAVVAAAVAAGAVIALARRRIGGYTGDVLGAACIVAETAALLALVTT